MQSRKRLIRETSLQYPMPRERVCDTQRECLAPEHQVGIRRLYPYAHYLHSVHGSGLVKSIFGSKLLSFLTQPSARDGVPRCGFNLGRLTSHRGCQSICWRAFNRVSQGSNETGYHALSLPLSVSPFLSASLSLSLSLSLSSSLRAIARTLKSVGIAGKYYLPIQQLTSNDPSINRRRGAGRHVRAWVRTRYFLLSESSPWPFLDEGDSPFRRSLGLRSRNEANGQSQRTYGRVIVGQRRPEAVRCDEDGRPEATVSTLVQKNSKVKQANGPKPTHVLRNEAVGTKPPHVRWKCGTKRTAQSQRSFGIRTCSHSCSQGLAEVNGPEPVTCTVDEDSRPRATACPENWRSNRGEWPRANACSEDRGEWPRANACSEDEDSRPRATACPENWRSDRGEWPRANACSEDRGEWPRANACPLETLPSTWADARAELESTARVRGGRREASAGPMEIFPSAWADARAELESTARGEPASHCLPRPLTTCWAPKPPLRTVELEKSYNS